MRISITPHFDSDEFDCHDGTPYPLDRVDADDSLGRTWRETRLLPLCRTFEVVRAEASDLVVALKRGPVVASGYPLHIDSGYRDEAYDQRLYDQSPHDGSVAPAAASQHPKGRAGDAKHSVLLPHEMFNLVLQLFAAGKLPLLGGVGLYPSFFHLDVMTRKGSSGGASDGHLRIWGGTRPHNIA